MVASNTLAAMLAKLMISSQAVHQVYSAVDTVAKWVTIDFKVGTADQNTSIKQAQPERKTGSNTSVGAVFDVVCHASARHH